jgi:hypothetical protein
MRIIQPLLLALLLIGTFMYYRRFRADALARLAGLGLFIVGAALVVQPEWATRVAALFGVGRGVDFFIYLSLFGIVFLLLAVFGAIRDLRVQVTQLGRATALMHAKTPRAADVSNHASTQSSAISAN